MAKDYKDDRPISREQFMAELRRYQKGSVSRRHFLGVTGLGMATAVMAGAMPGLRPRKARAERFTPLALRRHNRSVMLCLCDSPPGNPQGGAGG